MALSRDVVNSIWQNHLGRDASDQDYADAQAKDYNTLVTDVRNLPEYQTKRQTIDQNRENTALNTMYGNVSSNVPALNPTATQTQKVTYNGAWGDLNDNQRQDIAKSLFGYDGELGGGGLTRYLDSTGQRQKWEQLNQSGNWAFDKTTTPNLISENPNEIAKYHNVNGTQAGNAATVQNTATAQNVNPTAANTYDATKVGNNTPQGQAAQIGVNPNSLVTAQQGQLSQETQDAFNNVPQGTVDRQSTMKGQYEDLMNFDPEQGMPDWAKGASKLANQKMAARGVANSTMAGEAITSALMEAAKPIAQNDANTYAQMGLKNLDIKAQSTLAKANALAQLDMKNLDNRQQAAVMNAQTFLQTDFKNMDAEQQTRMINLQARLQTLLSDQAADNAAKQFNAASQNQVDQFFAQLNSQIDMFNSAQKNSTEQFNANQTNGMAQFNAQLRQQTEMFNAQNQLAIDQSNVQWRRNINTANTAIINAANQVNAQNLLGVSQSALNNIWQQFRDEADYSFIAGQNQLNRAHNIAMAAMQADMNNSMLAADQQSQFSQTLGTFGVAALSNASSIFSGLKGLFG